MISQMKFLFLPICTGPEFNLMIDLNSIEFCACRARHRLLPLPRPWLQTLLIIFSFLCLGLKENSHGSLL